MIAPDLLQALADRLVGLPANGRKPADFPSPAKELWQTLNTHTLLGTTFGQPELQAWMAGDAARQQLLIDIAHVKPGAKPKPPPPHAWQDSIRTLKDAYAPRLPLEFLVERTIVVPSLVIFYGAPGCLKSMLVADLAICVASGTPWLPPANLGPGTGRATMQAPGLWCDFDNGQRRSDERFEALGRGHGLPDTTPMHYVSLPNPWLNASDFGEINDLAGLLKQLGARFCVIDNLGTVGGPADENSAEMIQPMSHLRYLSEYAGVSVWVLHHQRKGSATSGGRRGESLRGHGSIEAHLDNAFHIEREEYSSDITIRNTKTRDVEVPPFGATFEYQHKPGTSELASARFLGTSIEDLTSDQAIQDEIIYIVQQNSPAGISQTDIVTAVKVRLTTVGVNRIRKVLGGLLALGTIITKPGSGHTVLHIVP